MRKICSDVQANLNKTDNFNGQYYEFRTLNAYTFAYKYNLKQLS